MSSGSKLCSASLEKIAEASPAVSIPTYNRAAVSAGIVHIGVGNFHRAHQCVFVDDSLSMPGHETWGYVGLGLMPQDEKAQSILKDQDMLYTLWEKSASSEKLRVVGCHSDYILAPSDPDAAIRALSVATTKIVTMTVTEKGYFIDLSSGKLDVSSPAVSHDVEKLKTGTSESTALKTAAGYLVAACRRRMMEGTGGFTVLSCDNVQENGCKARLAVLELAQAVDPKIASWIREEVAFPNSMVDRITPATTEAVKAELASKHGIVDGWPVVCESFLLWVVEDKFKCGRPDWDKSQSGKCIFVEDVVPYELMKLRLLNAVHQALSYPASLLGHELVHDAMGDVRVSSFLEAYMAAAGRTVPPVKGLEKPEWNKTVIERFSNPAIRDTIFRLTEDATNRIAVALAPCLESDAVAPGEALTGGELRAVLLPVACWIRCLLGETVGALPASAKLNRDDRAEALQAFAQAAWREAEGGSGGMAAAAFLKEAFGEKVARAEVSCALAEHLRCLQGAKGIEAALAASKL